MTENEIAKEIVDASFEIHTKLGPGLFESVYEEVLFDELDNRGFFLERQVEVPIFWNQKKAYCETYIKLLVCYREI